MWSKCYLMNKIPTAQKFPTWPHNFSNGPSPMQSYMHVDLNVTYHYLVHMYILCITYSTVPWVTLFSSCTLSRLSNPPDLVRILPILFENPESRPICEQDRKIPILTFFKWILTILDTRTPIRVWLTETDIQETLKNCAKNIYKIRSSTCTQSLAMQT